VSSFCLPGLLTVRKPMAGGTSRCSDNRSPFRALSRRPYTQWFFANGSRPWLGPKSKNRQRFRPRPARRGLPSQRHPNLLASHVTSIVDAMNSAGARVLLAPEPNLVCVNLSHRHLDIPHRLALPWFAFTTAQGNSNNTNACTMPCTTSPAAPGRRLVSRSGGGRGTRLSGR
jgi:hypothetical protein